MVPKDLYELLDGFVSESIDNLDDNEINISKLSEENNQEFLESIFRVFHTLKGLSGFFELQVIKKVTHEAETLLDILRSNPQPVAADIIDILYSVFDFLQSALHSAGKDFTDEEYKDKSIVLIEQVQIKISELAPDKVKSVPKAKKVEKPPTPAPIAEVKEDIKPKQVDENAELVQSFIISSNDQLEEYEKIMDKYKNDYNSEFINDLFRIIHSFKGPSALLEFNNLHNLAHESESLLDYFRKNPQPVPKNAIQLLYSILDFLKDALQYIDKHHNDSIYADKSKALVLEIKNTINMFPSQSSIVEFKESSDEELAIILKNAFKNIDDSFHVLTVQPDSTESVTKILNGLKEVKSHTDNLEKPELMDIISSVSLILETIESKLVPADSLIDVVRSDLNVIKNFISDIYGIKITKEEYTKKKTEPEVIKDVKKEEISTEAKVESIDNEKQAVPEEQKEVEKTKVAPPKEIPPKKIEEKKEVRVSTDKLNKLFDLVGEIITIETMLVNNQDLRGLKLPNFKTVANMMNKLIRELQKITMSIRMIPLEGIFNKMNRLVRDLSRKFEKEIELEIYGEDTEMDKNVIEQLADPLVHMIRNSIDHGVEEKVKRIELGKSPIGKIVLGAHYEGSEVHIVIEDDGAGLNREKILEKAISKGLIDGSRHDIPDSEVWQLIFEPGLSTAKEVTDISGRGVGMDVVRKNIDKLRGKIAIESNKGKGTKITFKIPLTLAIMDAMLLRVGSAKYAVPIVSVQESFQPRTEDITKTMDGVEVVKVRNQLFPVIRLYELMRREPDHFELENGILMMLNSHGKKICLFVDEILGQQQAVVKPLSEFIGDIQGVTGCMVMADGKIGLILDVDQLIQKGENFAG